MYIHAYHNTNASLDKFNESFIGKNDYGYAGRGFYFMRKPLTGGVYGKITVEVALTFNNPYINTKENWQDEFSPYGWIPNRTEQLESVGINWTEAKRKASADWTKEAIKRGYDGFVDSVGSEYGGEIVAFSADQIEIVGIEVHV